MGAGTEMLSAMPVYGLPTLHAIHSRRAEGKLRECGKPASGVSCLGARLSDSRRTGLLGRPPAHTTPQCPSVAALDARDDGRHLMEAGEDEVLTAESSREHHGIAMVVPRIWAGGPSELQMHRTPLSTALVRCLSIKHPTSRTPFRHLRTTVDVPGTRQPVANRPPPRAAPFAPLYHTTPAVHIREVLKDRRRDPCKRIPYTSPAHGGLAPIPSVLPPLLDAAHGLT